MSGLNIGRKWHEAWRVQVLHRFGPVDLVDTVEFWLKTLPVRLAWLVRARRGSPAIAAAVLIDSSGMMFRLDETGEARLVGRVDTENCNDGLADQVR